MEQTLVFALNTLKKDLFRVETKLQHAPSPLTKKVHCHMLLPVHNTPLSSSPSPPSSPKTGTTFDNSFLLNCLTAHLHKTPPTPPPPTTGHEWEREKHKKIGYFPLVFRQVPKKQMDEHFLYRMVKSLGLYFFRCWKTTGISGLRLVCRVTLQNQHFFPPIST